MTFAGKTIRENFCARAFSSRRSRIRGVQEYSYNNFLSLALSVARSDGRGFINSSNVPISFQHDFERQTGTSHSVRPSGEAKFKTD